MSTGPLVVGVILAAGASRRLGRPKQLVELGGEPLLRQTIRAAMSSKVSTWLLVLGAAQEEIIAAIGEMPLGVVLNSRYEEGQSTSVIAAIDALPSACEAVVFLLGDQPMVSAEVIDRLVDEFERTQALIVQPTYSGVPGNPVLVSMALADEMRLLTGDEGARPLIKRQAADVLRIEVGGEVPLDVDTEDDVTRLREAWAARK